MVTVLRVLVKQGNPFGFDQKELAELIHAVREEVRVGHEVRVACMLL